jgi:biofilm PGA synthesis N-glycosyltransferase PgaC
VRTAINVEVATGEPGARWRRRSPAIGRSPVAASVVLVVSAAAVGGINFGFGLLVAALAGERTWSAVAPMLAAGTAGSFAGLGIEYAVTRSVIAQTSWRVALGRVRPVAVSLTALVAVSVLVAAPIARFLHLGEVLPVPLSVSLFAASVLAAGPSGLLVGQRRIVELAAAGTFAALVRIGLLWVLPGTWVDRALAASVGSVALGAAVMVVVAARSVVPRHRLPTTAGGGCEDRLATKRDFGRFAATASGAQVVLWMTVVAPVVVARHYLPLRTAGELATVTFVASSLAYLAAPVATAFFPLMVVDRSRSLVRRGLLLSSAIVLVGAAGLVVAGPPVLRALYHAQQPHLELLLVFGAAGVLVETVSGFLVWAALARHDAVRTVTAGSLGAVPMIGLLWLWHSSAAAVLVAALPSTALVGTVAATAGRRAGRHRQSDGPGRPGEVGGTVGGYPDLRRGHLASMSGAAVPVSVGIMAYNEEAGIGAVVRRYLAEPIGGVAVDELVVVASGCTDRTVQAARAAAQGDPRVTIVDEGARAGKLAAVERFLAIARNELAVISGGDTLPEPGALQALCRPLVEDPSVGMVGPRVVPLPGPEPGRRLHGVLWELHDTVARRAPKLGEVVAVRRRACLELPWTAGCDEVVLEAAVCSRSLALAYAPEAVVRNRGPATIAEYVAWRRRLAAQHHAAAGHGHAPSTMQLHRCLKAVAAHAAQHPAEVPWLVGCVAVEVFARLAGWHDFAGGRHELVWTPTRSTRDGAISAA